MLADKEKLLSHDYKQLSVKYDIQAQTFWASMSQDNMIPCFNPDLINDIVTYQNYIETNKGTVHIEGETHPIKYAVAASNTPNIFNLGGNLSLMRSLILSNDRDALTRYAMAGLNAIAHRINRFNVADVTTISLVQGQALGAGLEAALTSDVIIAEKKSFFGFPEIVFNMFPGMGGYSLAARKIGKALADQLILKGKVYSATEAYEMGLVDVLVEDGQGADAVYEWIHDNSRTATGFLAFQKVKENFNPLTNQELVDITNLWIDTAFKISQHDLSIMERFIKRQESQFVIDKTEHEEKRTA